MRIAAVESWAEDVPLTRPYTIARKTTSAVRLSFVRIEAADGTVGYGSASPSKDVTGETREACAAALEGARGLLVGRDACLLGASLGLVRDELPATPAARAALDGALHDLHARLLGVPLVDLLGRRRAPLPTSVTIGILPLEETLAEAREHVGHGFRALKVKIGRAIDEDLERLRRLRAELGPEVRIRVDANEGYDTSAALRLAAEVEPLALELVEQPLPRAALDELRSLPAAFRACVALDEAAQSEADAVRLSAAPLCSSFVIKLMKCGGVAPALRIAAVAQAADRGLMWGCMDESVVSIAAALHAALASPATRFLDLDGSFDLAADPFRGGFALEEGVLRPLDAPGIGVRPAT